MVPVKHVMAYGPVDLASEALAHKLPCTAIEAASGGSLSVDLPNLVPELPKEYMVSMHGKVAESLALHRAA